MSILKVDRLTKKFEGLTAVNRIDFTVHKDSVTSLIGPNGAGKTTLFNLITGIYKPDEGTVMLEEQNIAGLKPDKVTMRGVVRTFQHIRLFRNMTVLENVMVGLHSRLRAGIPGILLRLSHVRKEERRAREEAYRLLQFVGLSSQFNEQAKNLPYGDQRRLEVARALAAEPKLLLLDEPAAGMNPRETMELTALVRRIRKEFGLTVLLIEHDMRLVMDISEHIIVLDHGEKIAEGTPDEIRSDRRVIQAYLGKSVFTSGNGKGNPAVGSS